MSFEERMALYKSKYDTTSGTAAPKPAGKRQPDKKKPRQSPGGKGKIAQQKPKEKTVLEHTAPEQAVPAKKGFLSRLLEKFKK
jgi:hypothetical protein